MAEGPPPVSPIGSDASRGMGLSDALLAVAPRVHLLAASVLIDAGALDAAWEPITEAARDTSDPAVRDELATQLLRLARGWRDKGDGDAAAEALRLAARVAPEQAIPPLAHWVQRHGSPDEALALWAEAIRVEPDRAEHHLHYGRLLETQGRVREARTAYLHLAEEFPSVATALTVAPRVRRLTAGLPAEPGSVVRIAMLGSAALDQLRDCLTVQAHLVGLRPEIHLTTPDRYEREIRDPESALHRFAPDLMILAIHRSRLFPDLDDLPCLLSVAQVRAAIRAGLDVIRDLLHAFRQRSTATVLLHNMVVPQHPRWIVVDTADELGQVDVFHQINLELARLVSTEFEDVHLVDEDAVQGRCGKASATDPRMWLAARVPWSEPMLLPLTREHMRHVLTWRGRARRFVVLALDDTLWGGRAEELGVSGVRLGPRPPGNAFLAFQRQLDRLRRRGVRLAACSSVARDTAVTVLESHPNMVVRLDHFAATRFGCRSKPRAIREIAADLGLALESVIFWDGSPQERLRMRDEAPEVLTPEVPTDPALHRQALLDLAVFEGLEWRA